MKKEAKQPTTKKCIHCKKDKPFDAFSKGGGTRDGKRSVCKECFNEKTRSICKERKDAFPF
jgi:hypothetical protein